MLVPVVLKNGKERSVRKDELQQLIGTERVMFFKRGEGWAVIGRDKMRLLDMPYSGEERRQYPIFDRDRWC